LWNDPKIVALQKQVVAANLTATPIIVMTRIKESASATKTLTDYLVSVSSDFANDYNVTEGFRKFKMNITKYLLKDRMRMVAGCSYGMFRLK